MQSIKIIIIIFSAFHLISCTSQRQILWVSGVKSECSAGAGKMNCLNVARSENLNEANWENFYSNIDGFNFEEGYLKKIEVRVEDLEDVPADASSKKYILIKEIEKIEDTRRLLSGEWILADMNNNPINRSIVLPSLSIDLFTKQISGSGGCNNYFGKINDLGITNIAFGAIASTKKACINQNDIEDEYLAVLGTATQFKVKNEQLSFYNDEDEKILTFLKKEKQEVNERLHDIWITKRISGNPINRMTAIPTIEFNLTEMRIFGNDSCNEFSGELLEVTEKEIIFGEIAATAKMCNKMEVADRFHQALSEVVTYQLNELNLTLLNENGEEVLSFLKGD